MSGTKEMRKIRYQNTKRIAALLLTGMLLAGICRADVGNTIGTMIGRELRDVIYESMVRAYLPSLVYTVQAKEQGKSIGERVMDRIAKTIPYANYQKEQLEYQTQIESELTYQMILEQEALDENYVNEKTGEVIVANETVPSEEKGDSIPENETEAATQSQDTQQEETKQETKQEDTSTAVTVTEHVPTPYPIEKLNDFDFLIHNFYIVDNSTTITGDQLNAQTLLAKSMKLTTTADQPQILIYHTHSQERYSDSTEDIMTGVVGVGEYLAQLLRDTYGLNVLHDMGTYDVEDRDHAYEVAGPAVKKLLADHPSIQIVIDLHRDGVADDTRLLAQVDGKSVASIMFFNGLSRVKDKGDIAYLANPYIEDNLAFSLQMRLAAEEKYPDFCRAVYLKGYRYNMHLCPQTLLVEVGAQTNTFQEAKDAMLPLADTLWSVIKN